MAQAIDFVNVLYERKLTTKSDRYILPQVPIMFNKRVMTGIGSLHLLSKIKIFQKFQKVQKISKNSKISKTFFH